MSAQIFSSFLERVPVRVLSPDLHIAGPCVSWSCVRTSLLSFSEARIASAARRRSAGSAPAPPILAQSLRLERKKCSVYIAQPVGLQGSR
jgi:hypothetical protein